MKQLAKLKKTKGSNKADESSSDSSSEEDSSAEDKTTVTEGTDAPVVKETDS